MSNSVLKVKNLTMQFGGVVAVNNFSLDVNEGEIVAIIGPNGAGKTTAFNAITGVYEPTAGVIEFSGEVIASNYPHGKMKRMFNGDNKDFPEHKVVYSPDKITKKGIARTFQNIRLFKSMTVFENVLTAMHLRRKSNLFTATFKINYKEEAAMKQDALELLSLVGLSAEKNELATSLPYGKQRRLEIARALATKPKLLLLDEPASGMNPQETQERTEFIEFIRQTFDISILLIEHHMYLIMYISYRIYVLNFGRMLAVGTPDEIQNDEGVIKAYLGGTEDVG